MRDFYQVFVIQDVQSGLFLTTDLGFTKFLDRAGRLEDYESAVATAEHNIQGDGYRISSFWQIRPAGLHAHGNNL